VTDLLIFGCVKKKRRGVVECRAEELYTSDLWNKRMAWLRATGRELDYIFSAQYGLIPPDAAIRPYERTLKDRHAWARRPVDRLSDPAHADRWRHVQANRFASALLFKGPISIELHAGTLYFEELERIAEMICSDPARYTVGPITIHRPLGGLGLGHQKQWYAQRTAEAEAS